MTLSAEHFDAYFRALWGHEPFPWQRRLARRVCDGEWPGVLDLPTASGKTACVDIAVFALAVQVSRPPEQRTVGRRIFFVVNRRVIVDEANQRAVLIARKLVAARTADEPDGILRGVANALNQLSGESDADVPPLDVVSLRGGIYRDDRWARSITQPTIVTSTIDQVGSRLLFRGYGVSDAARPVHAALIAHDSTILLDEAHISQPFTQTLDAVRRFRDQHWAIEPIRTPFAVVAMTATPGADAGNVFRLDDDDRRHPVLARRRQATKRARLVVAGRAKGKKAASELASVLAREARSAAGEGHKTVAVIVNRVATARAVYYELRSETGDPGGEDPSEVHLAIGRMRPIDRDDLTRAIQQRVGREGEWGADAATMYVVATQCLEVGADFDFDAMVTECASLDALRQRFGRLNRAGREIEARGCIVVRADQTDGDDPIYGSALAQTWKWLRSAATGDAVDFGIATMEDLLEGVDIAPMLAPRVDAPVLFPAYVDAWAQTSPAPTPDPDVSLFLHGPKRGEPDVNVCWRADLPEIADESAWTQAVSLCPPSSPECMPVPIGVVRAWLASRATGDDGRGETLDAKVPEDDDEEGEVPVRHALAWRGPSKSMLVRTPGEIRPGDTLVLPVTIGGWSVFGHISGAPADPAATGSGGATAAHDLARVDIAERAFRRSHGRAMLRLVPDRLGEWPQAEATKRLTAWVVDPEIDLRPTDIRELLRQAADAVLEEQPETAATLRLLAAPKLGLTIDRYQASPGIVLTTRRRVPAPDETPHQGAPPAMGEEDDETSRVARTEPIALGDHTRHVREELERALLALPAPLPLALRAAADRHDWGKADERFQAMLIGGDRDDAWAQPTLWAKSSRVPMSPGARRTARQRSGLPDGFRHEMLSVLLAECAGDQLSLDVGDRELMLHLIASHHGHARPFAPAVIDEEPPGVSLELLNAPVRLTTAQRDSKPMHRLDSGVAERFWRLTRRFGWWGLAYLEAVLRLADQRASAREDELPDVDPANDSMEAAT